MAKKRERRRQKERAAAALPEMEELEGGEGSDPPPKWLVLGETLVLIWVLYIFYHYNKQYNLIGLLKDQFKLSF